MKHINTKTASLAEIQDALAKWQTRNFPMYQDMDQHALIKHLKYGIIEEMGEFFHALLKREQGIRGTTEEHEAAMKDAIGDMLVYTAQVMLAEDLTFRFNDLPYYAWETRNPLLCASLLAEDVFDDSYDHLVSGICHLAAIFDIDAEQCFRDAAAVAMSRDWIKYPKNGVSE